MRATLLVITTGAVAMSSLSCSVPDTEWFGKIREPDPKHMTWCNSGEPEYHDPAMSSSTTDQKINLALWDGLTSHGPDGITPLPSLATHWEIAPDLKTYTFHLRQDGRWSNGRPITADDFVYGLTRVLHPTTGSSRAQYVKIKHGREFTQNRIRMVLADSGGFRAGELVLIQPEKDAAGKTAILPDTNERIARADVALRDAWNASAASYATVPRGESVVVIEAGGAACEGRPRNVPACDWAWVFWGGGNQGDGVYGWAPLAELDAPHAERSYGVASADDPARTGTLKGKELLMVPEVLGVSAPDPHTVVLRTKGPAPSLLNSTLQPYFRPTPREAVARNPKKWTREETIVTSGPYHLEDHRRRDKYELVKSPTFWGRDAVKLDRLTVLSMNDQSANVNLYYQGGCDALVGGNIPNSYLPVMNGELGGPKKRDYTRTPYMGIYKYLVNTEVFPNVHYRRALSHALDRSKLPKLLKGGQIPTASYTTGTPISQLSEAERALCGVTADQPGVALIIQKDVLCYVPPRGPDFDLEAARKELDIARQELGAKFPKKLTVRFNSGVEQHKIIAEWVQHEWTHNLGLEVELESQEWQMFLKATRNKEYDVARMGWIASSPDPENDFLPQYKCGAPDNRTGWCSKEYDALLAKAELEIDPKQRLEYVRQAEEILINDVPMLPFYVYTLHTMQKPYVRGVAINQFDVQSPREFWIEPSWETEAAK